MSLIDLKEAADIAITKIDEFTNKNGNSAALKSILNQMKFIKINAEKGVHPVNALEIDEKFTYSILASKEFASPEEMELKMYITKVSHVMDSINH